MALDRDLGESGIKVGAICPGGVKTEFAIGKSRTESRVAESGMPDPEDVWCGAPGLAHGPQNCVFLGPGPTSKHAIALIIKGIER